MQRLLGIVSACLAALSWTAAAEELGQADQQAIRSVIERQIAAFRADDGTTAFSFASPDIHALFGTAETFMDMVRQGYQPVYRPREVKFLDLTSSAEGPMQRVLLVGPDGVPVVADYFMERQADGTWLIDGCRFEAADDRTA